MEYNKEQLAAIGLSLRKRWETACADRIILEQQWLKNLRQYRKKYDPEIEDAIPKNRSKVYPGDTYKKVTQWVAKMMELMFPSMETNFDIVPTPYPSIEQSDLQNIIDGIRQQKTQVAQEQLTAAQEQGQQVPPVDPAMLEPTSEELEKAVFQFATDRAKNLMTEVEDQLAEMDHPDLSKRALVSGARYGCGVTEGPLVNWTKERTWEKDAQGVMVAIEKKVARPFFEHCKMWDIWPDLSAQKWTDQEWIFQRKIFARHELTALKKRDDIIKEAISEYLSTHPEGNYKMRSYENDLNALNSVANLNKRDLRKYEVIRYFGFISAHELRDCGITVPDSKMDMDILVDFWMLENIPIKAILAPFGDKPSDMFHAFIHMDDEDSGLTGIGLPEILRDTQMSRCAVRRMIMDNGASVVGPIFVTDESKYARGFENQEIHSFSTIHVDSQETPNFRLTDVVMQLQTESHITELSAFEEVLKKDIDDESNLPSWTVGNAQPLGEAFRTTGNMSQMTGGANIITKDNVRAYDRYTKSLIGSLIRWNQELNPKPEIKGDYNVQPKGTISLVSKEVRGAALDQMAQTLTPQERAYVYGPKLLRARFKARDLDADDLVRPDAECKQIDQQNAQTQGNKSQIEDSVNSAKAESLVAKAEKDKASAADLASQNQAKIAALLSQVELNMATAATSKDRQKLDETKTLLESLNEQTQGKESTSGPTKIRRKVAGAVTNPSGSDNGGTA